MREQLLVKVQGRTVNTVVGGGFVIYELVLIYTTVVGGGLIKVKSYLFPL